MEYVHHMGMGERMGVLDLHVLDGLLVYAIRKVEAQTCLKKFSTSPVVKRKLCQGLFQVCNQTIAIF